MNFKKVHNENSESPYETKTVLQVELSEIKYLVLLIPKLKRELKKTESKLDYFQDLHEIGEATSNQETARLRYEEKLNELKAILAIFEDMKKRV